MTISSTSRTAGPFAGTGANTAFPFSYKVFNRADVLVARTVTATGIESILTLDSDYTVVLNGNQNTSPGGIITLAAPLAVGSTLAATSNLPIQQSLDLTNQGGFYPAVINDALDRIVITVQQLAAKVGAGALNVGAAAGIASVLNAITNLGAPSGSTMVGGTWFGGVVANIYALGTSAGAALLGFLQGGIGAASRSLQDKTREWVTPEDFGATGVGDDTLPIQKMFNYTAPLRIWARGGGKTYKVSKVSCLTGQRVKSLYLESIGPLAGGAVSFQPVVEINGLAALKSDMFFVDVRVNGRRDLFPNIDVTLGEDGGMHAWRVVANAAGGVRDITWIDCEGTNAGSAGLAIHSPNPATGAGAATYPIKNLNWTGGKLTGNREHGWFADAFDGLSIRNTDCRFNGLDLNTTDAAVHGNRAFRSGAYLFGSAFDIESYGPDLVGSLWRNLTIDNVDCRACAMPAQMYNPIATNVAGYSPHIGLLITHNKFDKGVAAGADRAPNTDYSFNVLGNLTGSAYPYLDLRMGGNSFSGAAPQFNGVKGLTVAGGYVNSAAIKAHIYNCLNWEFTANAACIGIDLFPVPVPVFTKTQGSPGAAIATQNLIRCLSKAGGELVLHVEGTITGGLNADGDLIFSTVSPIGGMFITELYVSASAPIGVAVATAESVAANGTGTFWVDTVNSSTIYFKVVMMLSPAG